MKNAYLAAPLVAVLLKLLVTKLHALTNLPLHHIVQQVKFSYTYYSQTFDRNVTFAKKLRWKILVVKLMPYKSLHDISPTFYRSSVHTKANKYWLYKWQTTLQYHFVVSALRKWNTVTFLQSFAHVHLEIHHMLCGIINMLLVKYHFL